MNDSVPEMAMRRAGLARGVLDTVPRSRPAPSSSPVPRHPPPPTPRSWRIPIVLAILLTLIGAARVLDLYWPFRHRNMEPLLERVLASHIEIQHYRRIYFPHPGFVADGITLRRNSAPDVPPVGFAQHVRVEGRWIDLLLLRREVRLVQVNGLHVIIPPAGSRASREDFPPGSSNDFSGPSTFVELLEMNNAELDIQRAAGGQFAYPIRRLLIGNLRMGQAVSYDLDMQNAIPSGVIKAHGTFGPVIPSRLGATPVLGDLTFAPVNLADVHGIRGTLSLASHFQGTISAIEAELHGTTADFAVGHGRPTAVAVQARGSVNALNGDMLIHTLEARTGDTTVHAQGGIVNSPKVTDLDLAVTHGRAEDILRPFLHGPVPVTGPVVLHSHATIAAPGDGRTFLDRLQMDGAFRIPEERITSPLAEQKLTAFSARAQRHPPSPPSESLGVLSSISSTVAIRNGVAHAQSLTFQVPGAILNLSGTFNLRDQHAHLVGDLRMQTGISHLTTGFKSLLLKPLTPLFHKGNAGTVLPIAITGAPHAYKVQQDLSHRK